MLLSRRTFLARLVLESSPSPPVGTSALRLMDDESAIVVVFVVVVVVVVLLELPASQRAKSLAELNLSFLSALGGLTFILSTTCNLQEYTLNPSHIPPSIPYPSSS